MVPGKVKPGQTELIVFFAGHGLASNDGKELYILPQDSDPDLLERTALSRTELFKEIINLNPMSVTMFMDTCYSGISRDEKMLLASARPIRIVANDEEGIPDSFTIFSASQLDQISSGIKEAKHGIFSYYLMKGFMRMLIKIKILPTENCLLIWMKTFLRKPQSLDVNKIHLLQGILIKF